MEYEIKFQNEEDAKRGKESFKQKYRKFCVSDVHQEGSRFYVTTNDDNPRRTNDPWWFEFERPIFIYPVLKLSSDRDFLAYLENGNYSDLELEVEQEKIKKTFNVHRVILARNSDFFSKLLGGSFKEKNANKVTIEADIDDVENILKLIYGEKISLPTTGQSLQFLQSLDYFGLGINIKKVIKNMDTPEKDDFLPYMEELRKRYPDDKSLPKSIISTLGQYIEFLGEEDNYISFFTSFWSLLPKTIKKSYNHLLHQQ